jgi:Ring finger domain
MKSIISDFAISALRVWIVTPKTLDICVSDFAEFPVEAQTANLDKVALRIFLYAYACSSWTKASCYLQQRYPLLSNPSHQQLGYIHLIFGSYLIKQKRQAIIQLIATGRIASLAKKILKFFTIGMAIDELATFLYLYLFVLKRSVKGKPGFGTCMICLDDDIENGLILCKSSHIAHKNCIERWYNPSLPNHNTCPACRQPMKIAVVKVRNFDWLEGYLTKLPIRVFINAAALLVMTGLYSIQSIVFKWRLGQMVELSKSQTPSI